MSAADRKKELEARLAKARAAREEIQAEIDEVGELKALEAEVEQAERAAADAPHIAEALTELGPSRMRVVETDLGAVILTRPNHLLYRKFQDAEGVKTAELEKLVRKCLRYPDVAAFDRILEELPGTLMRCGSAIVELAGHRKEELSGK